MSIFDDDLFKYNWASGLSNRISSKLDLIVEEVKGYRSRTTIMDVTEIIKKIEEAKEELKELREKSEKLQNIIYGNADQLEMLERIDSADYEIKKIEVIKKQKDEQE